MGGRSSRTKGCAFEREIAQRLRPYDKDARRNVSETQRSSVDIVTKLPFGIQCKRMCEWPDPFRVWNQALEGVQKAKMTGCMPIGIVKVDYEPRTVVMFYKEHFKIFFCDLIKRKAFKAERRRFIPAKGGGGGPKGLKAKKFLKRKIKAYKVNPTTLLCEAFDKCLPGEEPLAIWSNLHPESRKVRTLYCVDLELFLNQIGKVYGKEENRSYNL